MNILTEIQQLWKTFDEGYKHSNDIILLDRILQLLSYYKSVNSNAIMMYQRFLSVLQNSGFLIKEEKQFLINYFILQVSMTETPSLKISILARLRDCASILDVWPEKQGARIDFKNDTYRREAMILLNGMYEVLGNHFL